MGETKNKVSELRQENPEMKAIDIAKRVGVSRERVRQILIDLGLPTNFNKPVFCKSCGVRIDSRGSTGFCQKCYLEALHETHWATLICDGCGKEYELRLSVISRRQHNKHHSCSNKCKGSWFGKKYGFGRKK